MLQGREQLPPLLSRFAVSASVLAVSVFIPVLINGTNGPRFNVNVAFYTVCILMLGSVRIAPPVARGDEGWVIDIDRAAPRVAFNIVKVNGGRVGSYFDFHAALDRAEARDRHFRSSPAPPL